MTAGNENIRFWRALETQTPQSTHSLISSAIHPWKCLFLALDPTLGIPVHEKNSIATLRNARRHYDNPLHDTVASLTSLVNITPEVERKILDLLQLAGKNKLAWISL